MKTNIIRYGCWALLAFVTAGCNDFLNVEQKGRTTKENVLRNFGMPNPESYRKAIRFMKQAEKFNRPVITFIDTKEHTQE